MTTLHHQQLRLFVDTFYRCPDCAISLPLAVAPAGVHGFYLGYVCPHCLYAADILGVLATRALAEALLDLLDPLPAHPLDG